LHRGQCTSVLEQSLCGNCVNEGNTIYTGKPGPSDVACTAASKPEPQEAITATIVFDYNCTFAQNENEKNFIQQFIAELAAALGVDESRITVANIACGSTIVDFTIVPSTNGSQPTPGQALANLQTQITEPGSPLRNNPLTGTVNTTQNITSTSKTVVYEYCSDGKWRIQGTCPASSGQSQTNLAIALGVFACVIFAVLLIVFIYRTGPKANQGPAPIKMASLDEDGPPGLEPADDPETGKTGSNPNLPASPSSIQLDRL